MQHRRFELLDLSYSTVRDYIHYCSAYPKLVSGKGDLKDVQRPWALEKVDSFVAPGGRVLDLGGSRCELAAVMAERYAVTVIDPYDGRAGGASSPDPYRSRHPELTIIQGLLEPGSELPPQQAVISTSVVEHIAPGDHDSLVEAIYEVLEPGGFSIHAIDLTCRGDRGFLEEATQTICQSWCDAHRVSVDVTRLVRKMLDDPRTFWLPVTMYDQWRKGRAYDDYPWRQVGAMLLVARKPVH